MARARNIKPGFFKNDILAEIEPLGRLLFAGLWTIADREGRLEYRPKRIKAEVLPYDDCNIEHLLTQLEEHEFIVKYTVECESYIEIVNFVKHQNPHKHEADSELPERTPYKHSTCTVQAPDKDGSRHADSLNPITDSLNPIRKKPDGLDSMIDSLDQGDTLKDTIREFIKMRKSIKAPMTERALTLLLTKLEKEAPGDTQEQIDLLEQSIMNSWKGIYPKGSKKNNDVPTKANRSNTNYDDLVMN